MKDWCHRCGYSIVVHSRRPWRVQDSNILDWVRLKSTSSRKTGISEMNGERGVLPAMGPAESLRRLTRGFRGTVEKLNLFQEISPVRSRCQNWKDLRKASGPKALVTQMQE